MIKLSTIYRTLLVSVCLCLAACNTSKQLASHSTEDGMSQRKNNAVWLLQADESQLSFISTKNKNISEEHQFKTLSGQINEQGQFSVDVMLESVETNIDIRNQRMRSMLFETDEFPKATITSQIDLSSLKSGPAQFTFQLNLHGAEKNYQVQTILDINDERIIVTSYEPVEVNAKDFSLDSGINALTQIAQLQSISYIVPVEFNLTFRQPQ